MRNIYLIMMMFLVLALAFGCGTEVSEEVETSEDVEVVEEVEEVEGNEETADLDAPIELVDFRGETVELDKTAERIACLLDSGLTILHMMDIVEEVVAVDKWTYDNTGALPYSSMLDSRLASRELPAITGNIEELLALQPDIVIIWSGHEDIEIMENSGLKVYGVQINSFDDVYKVVEDLGKIAGREERAGEIISYTKNELEAVAGIVEQTDEDERPAGMFVWGPTLLNIAGSDSTGNDIIVMAGGLNVAAEIDQEHLIANLEEVINWDPEVVVMWHSQEISPKTYYSDSQWQTVSAVKNERVFMLPDAFFCDLWTPKFQYSIKAAAKWLYPDLFEDIDLEEELDEMLEFLYGVQLR